MVSPLETGIQSGIMRIFDIFIVFIAMSMNARVGVWDEMVTAFHIIRCQGETRLTKVRARSQSIDVGRMRNNSIISAGALSSDSMPRSPRGDSGSRQSDVSTFSGHSSTSISGDSARTPTEQPSSHRPTLENV